MIWLKLFIIIVEYSTFTISLIRKSVSISPALSIIANHISHE